MKHIKKITLSLLFAISIIACQQKKGFKVTIDASDVKLQDSAEVMLQQYVYDEKGNSSADTFAHATFVDGIAVLDGSVELPERVYICMTGFNPTYFILENSDINVKIHDNSYEFYYPDVTGSKTHTEVMDRVNNCDKVMAARNAYREIKEKWNVERKPYLEEYGRLRKEKKKKDAVRAFKKMQNMPTAIKLTETFLNIKKVKKEVALELAASEKDTHIKFLLKFAHRVKTFAELEKELESLKDHYGEESRFYKVNLAYLTRLRKKDETERSVAIGKLYKDFEIADFDGNTVKLSDFVKEGNYVLLDFWASWCGPCRAEYPYLKKAYEKYHEKGLEIFSVSLDKKRKDWERATEEEKIPWINTCNLQAFESEIPKMYNVNGIPATFLIDSQGKIIARNLRNLDLDSKLSELFK